MLGTTVPEPNHDGRVFVCSAGVSRELGSLLRIYPLARPNVPNRWGVFRVPVERNPTDSRKESVKIRGDRSPDAHPEINAAFERLGDLAPAARTAMLAPYVVGSIAEANARANRHSLALIRPRDPGRLELCFRENPTEVAAPQLSLFADKPTPALGAKRFPFAPDLRFTDEDGAHKLQIRDWGSDEFMRKHLDDPGYDRAHLATALRLGPGSTLLVGTMNNRRNVWLIISVLTHVDGPPQLGLGL